MTSTMGPAAEMQRRIVNLLRADAGLSNTSTGLLFPTGAPQIDAADTRIYSANAQLAADAKRTMQLPRVLIEVVSYAHGFEQDDPNVLSGPVKIWTHTVVTLFDEEVGEMIDAYLARLLLSTWLSDARIIAARLAAEGARRRERIDAFDGAWQFVSGYATPNVGSLQ